REGLQAGSNAVAVRSGALENGERLPIEGVGFPQVAAIPGEIAEVLEEQGVVGAVWSKPPQQLLAAREVVLRELEIAAPLGEGSQVVETPGDRDRPRRQLLPHR